MKNQTKLSTYKKRVGTSGIRGQFYETKLLSLLLFKAQHNDDIQEFYLATNMDEIGAFDDICFKAKIKDFSRPLVLFLQAKHRDNEGRVLTLHSKNEIAKYFESFLKIKLKFEPNNKDIFFDGNFHETECVFVLYTTEKGEFDQYYEGCFADLLNDLIATGNLGSQPSYSNEYVDFLCKIAIKVELRTLATRFVKFINNKNNDMNDDLILRYHVILAEKVINVSHIEEKNHRTSTFRGEFFSNSDEFLVLFKDRLYEEVLERHASQKRSKSIDDKAAQDLLTSFFSEPCELILGKLIFENIIAYKNGRLEFVNKMPASLMQRLIKTKLPQSIVEKATKRAVKNILASFQFQVPAAFGNTDLMVRSEKRLNHLKTKILGLLNTAISSKIVTIDETDKDDGLLQLNGGLGSAVGNILVLDESTNLLKFNDVSIGLGKNSKALLEKLNSEIINLHEYRLDIRVKKFPKLSFNCNDHDLVKEFLSKLVFYTNQEDESGVGNLLKESIDELEGADEKYFRIKSEAIFMNFHEEVQNWWMLQKRANYLTKENDLYGKAQTKIIDDLMLNLISMMYMTEMNNFKCIFKDSSRIPLQSMDYPSRYIIITAITRFTFLKLTQSMADKKFVTLDLKYMLNLPKSDFKMLNIELKNTDKDKHIIIVCENLTTTSALNKNLQEIARAVSKKNIIIITNISFLEIIKRHFTQAEVVNDEGSSLFDLNEESRKHILKNTTVVFQGQEMSLTLLIDDVSVAFIKGAVLNKILQSETITIGESLEVPNRPFELLSYNTNELKYEINDLYIDRRVSSGKMAKNKILQTLHDIDDNIVLITAKPGMGKSTLLSYLSIKTKELNEKIWLLRINLLNYSEEFSKWKKNKVPVDIIHFMCQVILKNKINQARDITIALSNNNGEIYLEDDTLDEWSTFELKLFIHFFNRGHIIFLFDGFDEICPNYEDEVILFLNSIRNCLQKHKIWITSRPYNAIKTVLQRNFGISEPYELEPFTDTEQAIYFDKFWKSNLHLHDLSKDQLQNLEGFINFMTNRHKNISNEDFIRLNKPQNYLLNKVYSHFVGYLTREMLTLPVHFPLDHIYRDRLNYSSRLCGLTQQFFEDSVGQRGIREILEFVGTPLHLYLVAEYFLSGITDISLKTKRWDLDINTYAIYESFLESKLITIRFQDKNKVDINNPDMMETFTIIRKDFMDMHKKLAAYLIFQRNGQILFNDVEMKEIEALMMKIRNGSEKTGVIYSVSNDIPQFIHMTFAEYFAVEYISDILKQEKSHEKQNEIRDFILNKMIFESPVNVLNILDQKIKMDSAFSLAINNQDYVFNLLMSQCVGFNESDQLQVKSSLCECLKKDLGNILPIFSDTLENKINENNLDDFIQIIAKTGFLKTAAKLTYYNLIITILKLVRNIDIVKWRKLLSDPHYYYCADLENNTDLRNMVRDHILSYFMWREFYRESMISNCVA